MYFSFSSSSLAWFTIILFSEFILINTITNTPALHGSLFYDQYTPFAYKRVIGFQSSSSVTSSIIAILFFFFAWKHRINNYSFFKDLLSLIFSQIVCFSATGILVSILVILFLLSSLLFSESLTLISKSKVSKLKSLSILALFSLVICFNFYHILV